MQTWSWSTLALQVCAVSYCNRNLTDGFVSDRAVRGFGKSGKAPKIAVQMVKLGKWERIDGGYQIVGFLDWNPSKTEVLARRAAKESGCWATRWSAVWREQKQTASAC